MKFKPTNQANIKHSNYNKKKTLLADFVKHKITGSGIKSNKRGL